MKGNQRIFWTLCQQRSWRVSLDTSHRSNPGRHWEISDVISSISTTNEKVNCESERGVKERVLGGRIEVPQDRFASVFPHRPSKEGKRGSRIHHAKNRRRAGAH